MSNTEIWDALGKTDPEHTKGFQRGGGFKGTAVKPMYCIHKMTEYFGPCGKGWGMGKPEFQVVTADNEILVFCTVELWHGTPETKVYGVGGDKVLVQYKSGPAKDDEAFKKAFTDALTNAMKHIGVAADVHMGLFDDSKYVDQRKKEEADNRPKTEIEICRDDAIRLRDGIDACTTVQAVNDLLTREQGTLERINNTNAEGYKFLVNRANTRKGNLSQEAA